jgi:hypothetical protein
LVGALGLFLRAHGFQLTRALQRSSLPLLWAFFAFIVALQAFNLQVPSAAVGVLGIRNYLLYSVLLVMVPLALQYVRRPTRVVTGLALFIFVPVLVLGIYQYNQPINSWINQYAAEDAQAVGVMSNPRITGTFSYIQGMGTFLILSLGFSLSILIAGVRRGQRWFQLLGAGLLTLSLVVAPMNGSRSVIFGFLLTVPFVAFAAFRQGRRFQIVLALCVLIGAGYLGAQTEWGTQGWATFQHRVETAGDQDTRVRSMLMDPIQKIDDAGFLGYGAGSTHPGATILSSSGRVHPPGVSYEEELGRVMLELGLIGGALFLLLKLWVLWMTWRALNAARTPWEDVLSITAFVMAFLHLGIEKIVFNHVGGAFYWLCAGCAVWVWSRRSIVTSPSKQQPRANA